MSIETPQPEQGNAAAVETVGGVALSSSAPLTSRGRESMGDRALRILTTGSACVILLMLGVLVLVLFIAALPSVKRFGTGFLVGTTWRPVQQPVLKRDADGEAIFNRKTKAYEVDHYNPPVFGALPAIFGTGITTAFALVFAVPLSLGASLFLVRIAPAAIVPPVSFLIEFLAAIPSIAYGLWGMFVLQDWMGGTNGIEAHLVGLLGHIPGLRSLFFTFDDGQWTPIPTTGRDVFVAGIVLGIMIIPIITAISRDVLKNVPRAQTEGTIALGATWWQSCKEMLKYSRSGLFGAIILGLARAAGETMAVLMVMGSSSTIPHSPFEAGTTMASLLAGEFPEAATDDLHRGALMEVALVLLVMSLLFNIVARYLVVGKSARTASAH